MAGQFGQTPAGKRDVPLGRQFTGQCLDLHDEFWGKKTGGDPVGLVPPVPPSVP